MTYSSATIANYFLKKASAEGRALTPMQVIKLVYIAHGWHLGYYGTPLIDEQVQAWQYGPVIPSLYRELKQYGAGGVSDRLPTPFWGDQKIDAGTKQLLDWVYDAYGHLSGVQLSSLTHQPGTPWANAYDSRYSDIPMTNADIRKHYEAKIRVSA